MSAIEVSGPVRAAQVFAALGDPTRLALVAAISHGERLSLASLTGRTPLTRQAVAKHLHVLEDAGLVTQTRVGRESRFALRPEPLVAARSYLDDVSAQWDEVLGRLTVMVETLDV